jgi:lipopolysaccharide export system permease protein
LNNNSVGFANFLEFTSYLSIDIIAVILPIALAISAAFVYQRFNESNQLIALQAAGFSPRKMLVPLVYTVALAIGYLYMSNVYISPNAWKKFRALEFKIKNNIDSPEKSGMIFSQDGFSIYAQKYLGNFFYENLFIIDTRNSEKICSYFAESGIIQNNILALTNGERIEIDFLHHKNSIMRFQSYNYDLKDILKTGKKPSQPNEKYMDELLQENEDEATSKMLKALFHQKITSPLLAGIYAMLAFLLILLAPYARKLSNWRTIILMAIIIIFQGSYFWLANAAAKNLEFAKLNYILVIFSALVLIALIIKKRRL